MQEDNTISPAGGSGVHGSNGGAVGGRSLRAVSSNPAGAIDTESVGVVCVL